MKQIVFGVMCVLTASTLAGNQPTPTKKESVNEHKVLTGLKVTGGALGTALALYGGHNYYSLELYPVYEALKKNIGRGYYPFTKGAAICTDQLKELFQGGWVMGMYLYTAYSLGLGIVHRVGFLKADGQSSSEKKDGEKEHKVVSSLKATGAVVGAVGALASTIGFGMDLRTILMKEYKGRNHNARVLMNAIGLVCGVYSTYRLGETIPGYINRIRSK